MKIILLGYCIIISVGTLLLSLPCSTRADESTSFMDALFTSTSATCVTGLVRFDTFTHWTLFGQIVILFLIQIGGIGYITLAITIISLTKKKIGLTSRVILQDSIASPQVGGVVKMTKFIVLGSAITEIIGTVFLSFYFCPSLGILEGIYFALFHSVSAFCNAGFDLMGKFKPFSSLEAFSGNWYVCSVIILLIVIGGLGFFVWHDIISQKFKFPSFKLHTKMVIFISAILIFAGAFLIYIFEINNPVMNGKPLDERILCSLFQSVTMRTAGFSSVNLSDMAPASQALMICLMIIGGSTGSTAGGMKTTTFAVLIMSVVATFRKRKFIEAFGRRLDDGVIRTACCIFTMYIMISFVGAILISEFEGLPFIYCIFESSSAIGTVGVSLGITSNIGVFSEIILIFLMIFGRVGSITMLLAFSSEKNTAPSKLPIEKIQVG